MKTTLKLFVLLVIAGLPLTGIYAQQEILTASAVSSGAGGSVSWSVGLVAYESITGLGGTVTEGSQQPYEIFPVEGIEEPSTGQECTIFPNPTTGKVTLKFSKSVPKGITACLSSAEGALLRKIIIDNNEISIPMDELRPAAYILTIMENEKPVKTYKIIKK